MLFINVVTNLTFKIITALFSKALDGVNVKEMISNISSGAGAAPAAAAAPAAQAAAPADDKKGNIGTQNQERNQMDRKGRGIKLKEIGRILVWVQIGKKYRMEEKIEVGRNRMDVKGIYWGKNSG